MTGDRIRRLLGPDGPEVSCETCFEELDRYVELELAGDDAEAAVPGMRAHLEGCPACAEDHAALRDGIATALTPHQREVLVAVALNDVPIDVLAERLSTTRGALYKTLHDARHKLRGHLDELGLTVAS